MIEPTHCQCLLFVMDNKTRDAKYHSSETTSRSLRNVFEVIPAKQAFILIPEAFMIENPKLIAHFRRNNLPILCSENVSSLFDADDLELIEIMLESNPESYKPLTLIMDRNFKNVRSLLSFVINVARGCGKSVEGLRPAIDDANSEAFNSLLAHRVASRHESIFRSKSNVLHVAVKTGHEEFVRVLLDQGAGINRRDIFSDAPLHEAAYFNRAEIVQLLINRGAAVELKERDGCTPLHLAAWRGHSFIVSVLLDHGAMIECRDLYDRTPLHYAATGNRPQVVEMLIERGAVIETKDRAGRTPLFKINDVNIAELLLGYGADVNAKSKKLRTPIFCAAEREAVELVETLLKYGARVDVVPKNEESLLKLAFRCLQYNVFKYLLESVYVEPRLLKESAIHDAVLQRAYRRHWVHHPPHDYLHDKYWEILSRHTVKIVTLYSNPGNFVATQLTQEKASDIIKFKRLCELEALVLMCNSPRNTDESWFEILTRTESQVAQLCRNNTCVSEMIDDFELKGQFPIYESIGKHLLRKATFRKSSIEEGIKMFNFLSFHFKGLPYKLKERIVSYLNNLDILILKRSFKHLNASLENRET